MNYFIVMDGGETGPHPPITINRLFQNGQLRADQLCRAENSQQYRRLDEVFRHFAPSPEIAAHARRRVARWNQKILISSSLSVGPCLTFLGVFRLVHERVDKAGIMMTMAGLMVIWLGVVAVWKILTEPKEPRSGGG